MIKLEELAIALATVIVTYHDANKPANKKIIQGPTSPRDYCLRLLSEENYKDNLMRYIDAATQTDPTRKDFLLFLLHEIDFIKTQLLKKEPFSPDDFRLFTVTINQLLLDMKQLLVTIKSSKYNVTFSQLDTNALEKKCLLEGMIEEGTLYNTYRLSGSCLNTGLELVLGQGINWGSRLIRETLATTAQEWAREFNYELLVTQNAELKQQNAALNQQIESLTRTQQVVPISDTTESIKLKTDEALINRHEEQRSISDKSVEQQNSFLALEKANQRIAELERINASYTLGKFPNALLLRTRSGLPFFPLLYNAAQVHQNASTSAIEEIDQILDTGINL